MARGPARSTTKSVETLTHDDAARKNIPTAELQSFAEAEEAITGFEPVAYPRARPLPRGETRPRDPDLDPQIVWNGIRIKLSEKQVRVLVETGELEIGDAQLVWRGKDQQDWSDLVVHAPPLYIQEKIHPKAIVDELRRVGDHLSKDDAPDLFSNFNGLAPDARTEFYAHDQHWSNRMILGDSLQVMASLAQREGLKGQVQCIYFDPPYGIKFNSNWQVSTQSRDVKDGKQTDVPREPEQVKAFRDTWKDSIHSYLTYLRDRLTVARELLHESGSIFVQIGDENVHRVRAVMDEVFGEKCSVTTILAKKKGSQVSKYLESVNDYIIWYTKTPKSEGISKFRTLYNLIDDYRIFETYNMVELTGGERISIKKLQERDGVNYSSDIGAFRSKYPDARLFSLNPLKSGGYRKNQSHNFDAFGKTFPIGDSQCWKHTVVSSDGLSGMDRLLKSNRLFPLQNDVRFVRYAPEPPISAISNWWDGLGGASAPIYVVQTNAELVKRCILMTTDPGDLVVDPTCGSGTTAFACEQWARRWIVIDTSRVALALTRMRIMGSRFPYYILADSREGRIKIRELTGRDSTSHSSFGDVRQGFVTATASWSTSGSIANNFEIDAIDQKYELISAQLRQRFNEAVGQELEEWQIPIQSDATWTEQAQEAHTAWRQNRHARQCEIDASIRRLASIQPLYDQPYSDTSKVRVAGPFTVESLSPHRVIPTNEPELDSESDGSDDQRIRDAATAPTQDFAAIMLENLAAAGVQGRDRADRVRFTVLQPWPGRFIGAEGRFTEGDGDEAIQRRAAILIGPEFGTLSRPDLVAAAREAADARFDVLVACAFAYDAHASELTKLGPLPILQAKMSPDLHMANDLKTTGKGNLFVVFGEPDIDVRRLDGDQLEIEVKGIDVFDPNTGDVRSDDTSGIAAWFVDTDYNEESFFVRHAYFLGANDPYKMLRAALKAEIDESSWATLYRATSRPFVRPRTGRIAVKIINHFGDEVMKVYTV